MPPASALDPQPTYPPLEMISVQSKGSLKCGVIERNIYLYPTVYMNLSALRQVLDMLCLLCIVKVL